MIQKQRCLFYFVGEQAYKTLEDAQKADLILLMPDTWEALIPSNGKDLLTDWILKNSKAIVDTLTATPRSHLGGRKSHGAVRKPRASKALPIVS